MLKKCSLHKIDVRWANDSCEFHAPPGVSIINRKPRPGGRKHFKYVLPAQARKHRFTNRKLSIKLFKMCLARRRHEKLRFTNRKLLIKPPKVCFDRRRNSNFRFTNRKLLITLFFLNARRRREKKRFRN